MVNAVGPSGPASRDQLSSRALALVSAGANLVICASLVTVLLVVAGRSDINADAFTPPASEPATVAPPPAPAGPDQPYETSTAPPATTPSIPNGFQPVSGPGGMATVIPAGWPSVPAKGPGAMQSDDPADPSRFLRYGGSDAPAEDIYSSHIAYEREFSQRPGFTSWRLDKITFHGFDAVDWEFEWDSPEGRRHVRSQYWRSGGYEFFVYASSSDSSWPETQPILDAMINNSSP